MFVMGRRGVGYRAYEFEDLDLQLNRVLTTKYISFRNANPPRAA